ncbi:hypothetical protein V6N13_120049 [Hibiscus sabdariffa]
MEYSLLVEITWKHEAILFSGSRSLSFMAASTSSGGGLFIPILMIVGLFRLSTMSAFQDYQEATSSNG